MYRQTNTLLAGDWKTDEDRKIFRRLGTGFGPCSVQAKDDDLLTEEELERRGYLNAILHADAVTDSRPQLAEYKAMKWIMTSSDWVEQFKGGKKASMRHMAGLEI